MKDYYKVKKISNSSLSWFQKSPKYFKYVLDKDEPEEKTSFYDFGEQLHQYILEPQEFEKNYIFFDYEMPKSAQQKEFCEAFANKKKGTVEEKLLEVYKNTYSSKESDEKALEKAKKLQETYKNYIKYLKIRHSYVDILQSKVEFKLNDIKKAIFDHEKAKELIYNEENATFGNNDKLFIKNEFEIYWTYPNGLECKSMLDRIIIDHENKKITLIDLKTTSHLQEFKNKFEEYKYYRQMAFYWMAIHWYFFNELKDKDISTYEKETYIIAIGKDEPIEIKVFKVSEPQLTKGLIEIEDIMSKLEWHYKNDKWEYSKDYYEGKTTEVL